MQISANSTAYGDSQAQRLLTQILQPPQTPAGQELPAGAKAGGHGGHKGGHPHAAPPSGGAASTQFASETLQGLLSTQEVGAGPDPVNSLVQQADTDGDGALSAAELQASLGGATPEATDALTAAMAQLDSDKDGKLSAAELGAGAEASRPERSGQRHSSADMASKLIGDVDTDGDGALNAGEVNGALGADAAGAFGQLDTDGDGKLNAAELGAALDTRRAAHAPGGQGEGEGDAQPQQAMTAA